MCTRPTPNSRRTLAKWSRVRRQLSDEEQKHVLYVAAQLERYIFDGKILGIQARMLLAEELYGVAPR